MKLKIIISFFILMLGMTGCSGEVQNEDIRDPRENGAMEPDGREPVMTDD